MPSYVAATYSLSKSVIISSTAPLHIVNDISRFFDGISPAKDNAFVSTISGQLPILGYGNALVNISNGGRLIMFNAAYCPGMCTTMASSITLLKSGIYWSNETGSLYKRDERGEKLVLADCKVIDNLFMLEYCPTLLQPKVKSDSRWLRDAGYTGKRGLKKFMMVYGLKLPMDYEEGKRYIDLFRGADQHAWEAENAERTEVKGTEALSRRALTVFYVA